MTSKTNKKPIKVKNPCKLCSRAVDKSTGLQCQGACKKWSHFGCLNIQSQEVDDIRTGYLIINCPCPDCENENKVYQYADDNTEESKKEESKKIQSNGDDDDSVSQYKCKIKFCPGVPVQKVPRYSDNVDLCKQAFRPPYGVSEGTSYECTIDSEFQNTFRSQDDIESMDLENEEEEISDAGEIERTQQTSLLAISSSILTAAMCCDGAELSQSNVKTPSKRRLESECCSAGSCSLTSSTSRMKKENKRAEKPEKKERNKLKKKLKHMEKEAEKKHKKEDKKARKKSKKEAKVRTKHTKVGSKGNSPTLSCCRSRTRCCNADVTSVSNKSSSSSSQSSVQGGISNRPTQSACGKMYKECSAQGATNPVKLMKSEGCNVNVDLNKNARQGPRYGPGPIPGQIQYPRTPGLQPYFISNPNCPPSARLANYQPGSKCPPNCPGPALGRNPNILRSTGNSGKCQTRRCEPMRAQMIVPLTSSALLYLSTENKSKSCCTLDRTNNKGGKLTMGFKYLIIRIL